MKQTNIIKSLCNLMEDEDSNQENKPYKKEMDESNRLFGKLEKLIKKDENLYKLLFEYDMADGLYEGALGEYYFREGFLRGARLMMEICGFTDKKQ